MSVPSISVGRLRKVGFALEAPLSTAYPHATFVAPNLFPRVRPPANMFLKVTPLESPAIGTGPFFPFAIAPGPESIDGATLPFDVEPGPELWQLLFALFGQDTVTDNHDSTYSHKLQRIASELLPTYSWQIDAKNKQLGVIGSMLDQVQINFNAKELVSFETNWKGLGYKPADPAAFSFAPTVSRVPLSGFRIKVSVGGSQVTNIRTGSITIKNNVQQEWTVQQSTRGPSRIYSEGMNVECHLEAIFEDTTEYAKFLAQTDSSLELEFLGNEVIDSTVVLYKFTISCPYVRWKQSDLPLPSGLQVLTMVGVVKADQTVGSTFGEGITCTIMNGDSGAIGGLPYITSDTLLPLVPAGAESFTATLAGMNFTYNSRTLSHIYAVNEATTEEAEATSVSGVTNIAAVAHFNSGLADGTYHLRVEFSDGVKVTTDSFDVVTP
ncbi:MAG TPA: phage tail tube protein [Candidatus Saccharimonadales bacterium]|nr:phage tail tube protein [Candidatus Saccharimonadales bacterium]